MMSRQHRGCRSQPKHIAGRMASCAVTQIAYEHDAKSHVQAADISPAYTVALYISHLFAHDQHAITR